MMRRKENDDDDVYSSIGHGVLYGILLITF